MVTSTQLNITCSKFYENEGKKRTIFSEAVLIFRLTGRQSLTASVNMQTNPGKHVFFIIQ